MYLTIHRQNYMRERISTQNNNNNNKWRGNINKKKNIPYNFGFLIILE